MAKVVLINTIRGYLLPRYDEFNETGRLPDDSAGTGHERLLVTLWEISYRGRN